MKSSLEREADEADRRIFTVISQLEYMCTRWSRDCDRVKLTESIHLLRHARIAVRLLMNEEDVKRT